MADADYAAALEAEGQKGSARKKHVSCYLPQELVSNFLLRIPAQGLHDVMRRVCREWNLLIRSPDFIYSHLRNSTGGLLFMKYYPDHSIAYVEMRGKSVEIAKFDCGFEGRVINSCNGLVLARGPGGFEIPFVINPLTKQRATLPSYYCEDETMADFTLGFAEASKEYKVVCSHDIDYYGRNITEITVLTLGVDRVWRDISVEHLTPGKRDTLLRCRYVTGGYMHWIGRGFLMTLNVETETFHQFPLPRSLRRSRMNFLPMGSKLSCVDQSRKFSRYIWQMNSETGEWTMLHCIDLKPLRSVFYDLFRGDEKPLTASGWLVPGEVLVLDTRKRCYVAYNVKTKEIMSSFELPSDMFRGKSHVNSLVWFEVKEEDSLVSLA